MERRFIRNEIEKGIYRADVHISFLFVNFLKTALKRAFFGQFFSNLFLNNSEKYPHRKSVRVRGIFQSYDVFHKRDNKKARNLGKCRNYVLFAMKRSIWKMDFRFFGEQKSSKETNE